MVCNMKAEWVNRQLDVAGLLEKSSCFLLGPRQTGKTSLIQRRLPSVLYYDLLDSATYHDEQEPRSPGGRGRLVC